jgi:hypothetical protein
VERLEDRLAPAGNVTSSFTGGNLTLTGDALANSITISENASGQIVVTPNGTTTLDGHTAAETFSLTGNLTIALGAGNDSINFDKTNPLTVPGSLSITYGSATGDKQTQTIAGDSAFTVGQNLAISYGAGAVVTFLADLQVGSNSVPHSGNVTITHGPGNSDTTLFGVGFGSILGNLSVTNTSGVADNALDNLNVGGNVTFSNGRAGAGNAAGHTFIRSFNTTPARIGGNLAITNVNGNSDSVAGDVVTAVSVAGNVTLKLGTGNFNANVTAGIAPGPPAVGGNLSITGSGNDAVGVGVDLVSGISNGLNVNGSLSVRLGGAGSDVLDLTSVVVGKGTTLTTGTGNATVTFNDVHAPGNSEYHGAFSLTTGGGNDGVNVNSSGGAGGVIFDGPVTALLGPGNDSLSLAIAGGVSFLGSSASFDGQGGTNHAFVTLGNVTGAFPTLTNFLNG